MSEKDSTLQIIKQIDHCLQERKSCCFKRKRKLKFEDYKKCLKASQIINIVHSLEKKYINDDSLKEDKKEFIKNILLLKPQGRFKSERHVLTQEINKIVLSSNDYKIIQLIDSFETYSHGMNKDLIRKI